MLPQLCDIDEQEIRSYEITPDSDDSLSDLIF